jgi:hypothetical protein
MRRGELDAKFWYSENFLEKILMSRVICAVWKLIYKIGFTFIQMYTRQTLVRLLYVSARHWCHHHGILSVAKVAPSK